MEQAINIEPEAQPVQQPERALRSKDDLLIDAALSFVKDSEPARKPRPEREAPEDDDGGREVEEPLPGEPENDNAAHDSETEGEGEEAHDTRGSREDPFTVKDLPKDKFIELKVDGEKTVVTLDELAAGYIRENTFSQRLNKTKSLADEAQAAIQKAKETRDGVREAFQSFVGDPEQIFEFFTATAEREAIFEAAAMRYAGLLKRFRENPQERLQYERQRDQARLNAEREAFREQQRQEMEAKQKKEQYERAVAVFNPGWQEGLKRAGFPQPTPALYEEVVVRCNQRAQSGQQVTSDDVAEFVHRAAKLLELPPAGKNKPKPAPAPAPRAEPRRRQRDPWADKTPAQRRQDPDYFLRNLKGLR